MIIGDLGQIFLQFPRLPSIGLATCKICENFAHLYSAYVNINADDLAENLTSMKAVYDVNLPIGYLFKRS